MSMEPQVIPVGQEPPPLHRFNESAPLLRHPQEKINSKEKRDRRATADRFGALNGFVDFTLAGLTRNEIAVWLVLYRDTKPDGTAQTGQADIARRVGVTDRTVRNVIKKLADKGLLQVIYRGGIRRGVSTYRVLPLPQTSNGKKDHFRRGACQPGFTCLS